MNLVTHPVIEVRVPTPTGVFRMYLRRVPAVSGPRFTRDQLDAMTDDEIHNELISQHLFDEHGRRIPASGIAQWPQAFRDDLLAKISPRFVPPLGIQRAYRG